MKSKADRLAAELRALADRLDGLDAADDEAVSELGAQLLAGAASIAHRLNISRDGFAGLARVSWSEVLRTKRRAERLSN